MNIITIPDICTIHFICCAEVFSVFFFASIWIHWKNRTRLKFTNANRPIKCGWLLIWNGNLHVNAHQWDVTDLSITFDWQYSAILVFSSSLRSFQLLYFDLDLNFKCEKEIDLIAVYVVVVVAVVVLSFRFGNLHFPLKFVECTFNGDQLPHFTVTVCKSKSKN